VETEQTSYTLRVSGYSGNAGFDAVSLSNGMMFTTYDRDNDPWTYSDPIYNNNCAVIFGGGFWYKNCAYNTVNGLRGVGDDFAWYGLAGGRLLQSCCMWLLCR